MKLTRLNHSGLLFDNGRVKILVDPFFSDNLSGKNVKNELPDSIRNLSVDVLLITHEHPDHLDPEALERILSEDRAPVLVMAPERAYQKLLGYGGAHNYVMMNPHSVWSEQGITFYAVHAEHTDRSAVGFIIDDGEKTYYISGDTVYNYDVIDEVLELVEDGVDYAFLPISGRYTNMNAKDAADFAFEIDAKCAVPVHYGMLDEIDPESFDYDGAKIVAPNETVEL